MRKKIIFLFIVLLMFLGFKTQQNLIYYSVYYAQNMPHDSRNNPELVFILKNLETIKKPDLPVLSYDYDGSNSIKYNNDYSLSTLYYKTTEKIHNNIILLQFKSGDWYYFSKNAQFLYKKTTDGEKITNLETSTESKNMIYQAIYPIIEVQPEPEVNLQWLFNLIYQRQFE